MGRESRAVLPSARLQTRLNRLRHFLDNSSVVTRWRGSNPELVGTDQDCVGVVIDKVQHIIEGSDGVNKDAKVMIGLTSALLVIKRS